jgi:exosome complex component RRP42
MAPQSNNLTLSDSLISSSEKRFILEGCLDHCRQDGRARNQARPYSILSGGGSSSSNTNTSGNTNNTNDNTTNTTNNSDASPLILSNGSARLFLPTGETHIVCSIKAEIVHPSTHQPNRGVLELAVDTLSASSRNDELESTLLHLLGNFLVDYEQLCIVPHYYVWRLSVDLMILCAHGGSIVDACSRVLQAALRSTKLPLVSALAKEQQQHQQLGVSDTNVNGKDDDNKPALQVDADIAAALDIPGVDQSPVIVTVTILKCQPSLNNSSKNNNNKKLMTTIMILDATKQEEACAFAQVHVAVDSKGTICAVQKAGGGSLPLPLLQDICQFAMESLQPNTTTTTNSGEAAAVSLETNTMTHQYLLQEQFSIQQ